MSWEVNEHVFRIPAAFAPEAQDHAHAPDQDLILRLTAGKRSIRGATRTTGSSGATTAASGGRTTSEVEGGATFSGGATSVVAAAAAAEAGEDPTTITTTTTSGHTGRITSRTCTKSSDSNSRTGRRPGVTIPRRSQEAPLMAPLTTRTNPPRLSPGSPIIRPPPRTRPPPKASRPCWRFTVTPKM